MKTLVKKMLARTTGAPRPRWVSGRDLRLLDTVKRELLPPDYEPRENYVPQRRIGHAGFSLKVESQLELLESFRRPELQALFQGLRNNGEINIGLGGREFKSQGLIHNGFYPTPDAELYAAMIAWARPETIIEIGSGYSTVIARSAITHLGLKCDIHTIDPQPRRDIANMADRIEYKPVEQSSLADHQMAESTLLFIDSSHVCRSDGDLPFLYCRILPMLPAGVLVHIHDIFVPFDYPDNYFERFYTEQYLLQALLAQSTKFEVVLATHYLSREHAAAMQAVFGPAVGDDPLFFGASFWMRSK
jgi:hypothetical protein